MGKGSATGTRRRLPARSPSSGRPAFGVEIISAESELPLRLGVWDPAWRAEVMALRQQIGKGNDALWVIMPLDGDGEPSAAAPCGYPVGPGQTPENDLVDRAVSALTSGPLAHDVARRLGAGTELRSRGAHALVDPAGMAYMVSYITAFADPSQEGRVKLENAFAALGRDRAVTEHGWTLRLPYGQLRHGVSRFPDPCAQCGGSLDHCGLGMLALCHVTGLKQPLVADLAVRGGEVKHLRRNRYRHPGEKEALQFVTTWGATLGQISFSVSAGGLDITEFTLLTDRAVPCPLCGRRPCGHDLLAGLRVK